MKLYHIDRSGYLKEGQTIELIKNFATPKMQKEDYFLDGLSSHGLHYFTHDAINKDYLIDAVFEYERMLHYPEKLSRFQAFYCFDRDGLEKFVKTKYLEDNFYKIYEIDVPKKNYERHNMELVRGWSFQSIVKYARLYWKDKDDIYKEDAKTTYEYLVKLPITIGKEVELSKIIKNKKQLKPKSKKEKN